MARYLPILGVAWMVLCGCASTVSALQERLANSQVCCQNFSQLEYHTLTLDQPQRFDIDEGQSFVFDSGKSFFKAFRLPRIGGPYQVELRSYFTGGLTFTSSHLFYPVIMTLGQDYRVRQHYRIPEPELSHRIRQDMRGNFLAMQLALDSKDAYLIVFTEQESLGQGFRFQRLTSSTSTVYTPNDSFLVTLPVNIDTHIPFAAGGRLRIILQEQD